jgi:hypothetical protein
MLNSSTDVLNPENSKNISLKSIEKKINTGNNQYTMVE